MSSAGQLRYSYELASNYDHTFFKINQDRRYGVLPQEHLDRLNSVRWNFLASRNQKRLLKAAFYGTVSYYTGQVTTLQVLNKLPCNDNCTSCQNEQDGNTWLPAFLYFFLIHPKVEEFLWTYTWTSIEN